MQRLADADELLDGPLDDTGALIGNLRDLGRINTLLGGARLSLRALLAFQRRDGRALQVLDIGTGGADIPAAVLRGWPADLPLPIIVAADSRPEVVAAARVLGGADPRIDVVVADGLALPWPIGAFDVAHASLVLHHLEPIEAVRFLRELARVARQGVVINDLDRAWVHWLGAWLIGHLLTRNRLTRRDAPLSVRRAYTVRETARLLVAAGLRPVLVRRGFLWHRYAITAVASTVAATAAAAGAEPHVADG